MRGHFTIKEYSMRKNCIMTVLMYPDRDVSAGWKVVGLVVESGGDHYELIDAADVLLKDGVGHSIKEKGQHRMTSQKEHQMQCTQWLIRARK